MYVLFSGEGPTDLGAGRKDGLCEGQDFEVGPLAKIVDRLIEETLRYSLLETENCGFFSKSGLLNDPSVSAVKPVKKQEGRGLRLPGKKFPKEARFFFNNARILALIAKKLEEQKRDEVVAVLFRDADGTSSEERGMWEKKWKSMLDGFEEEGFTRGVPMLPKPKSEAWFLCSFKAQPYENCEKLEEASGNDDSPNSLKRQLEEACGRRLDREELCRRAEAMELGRIEMPSFQVFRERLKTVLGGEREGG